eukprot:CAMPEP_0182821760 /NCGR_PEP_ID=MMETSP0006_2-20121128/13846_1 /TAXON_ID=97485 /ORGANISM="Prymnesium parvum, Strain Texoma1" /LENGTH=360 /DNA_ID=CAMNT_0024948547 /DNA_START=182 /DNA_END=1264 /DNA_ORIENTATION=-
MRYSTRQPGKMNIPPSRGTVAAREAGPSAGQHEDHNGHVLPLPELLPSMPRLGDRSVRRGGDRALAREDVHQLCGREDLPDAGAAHDDKLRAARRFLAEVDPLRRGRGDHAHLLGDQVADGARDGEAGDGVLALPHSHLAQLAQLHVVRCGDAPPRRDDPLALVGDRREMVHRQRLDGRRGVNQNSLRVADVRGVQQLPRRQVHEDGARGATLGEPVAQVASHPVLQRLEAPLEPVARLAHLAGGDVLPDRIAQVRPARLGDLPPGGSVAVEDADDEGAELLQVVDQHHVLVVIFFRAEAGVTPALRLPARAVEGEERGDGRGLEHRGGGDGRGRRPLGRELLLALRGAAAHRSSPASPP